MILDGIIAYLITLMIFDNNFSRCWNLLGVYVVTNRRERWNLCGAKMVEPQERSDKE